MRLVWDNCIFYNGKQNGYGKLGERQSRAFEEMWAASGLDTGSRHRRSTAGHAAMRSPPPSPSKFLIAPA